MWNFKIETCFDLIFIIFFTLATYPIAYIISIFPLSIKYYIDFIST